MQKLKKDGVEPAVKIDTTSDIIVHPAPPAALVPKRGDKNIAPTTTASADLVTAGQRRVNLIWEMVQAVISLSVVFTALVVAARLSLVALHVQLSERLAGIDSSPFLLLSNLSSLVVGFYFGRTNHQRTGGVGPRDAGR